MVKNSKLGNEHNHFIAHYEDVNLFLDPIYEYICFTKHRKDETSEEDLVDSAWVQRLRRIHQLQSAWWVFPSAEHSRFQHSIGVMHLAGQFAVHLYTFLEDLPSVQITDLPSWHKFVETARIAGLLHDIGHGPFGHYFDNHYLRPRFNTNHEAVGQKIVTSELKPLIEGIRRSPWGELKSDEQLAASEIAYVIKRPNSASEEKRPYWLRLIRLLFSGIYTADNLDYISRDAYMTGVCTDAVDISRLIYYSYIRPTASGEPVITLHRNGASALRRFLQTRFYMYDSIYNHRTVRAIEIEMEHVFSETVDKIISGNPLDNLESYLNLDEWSLISKAIELARTDPGSLGKGWQTIIDRNPSWKMAYETRLQREERLDALDLNTEEDREERENRFKKAIFQKISPVVGTGISMDDIRVDIVSLDLRPETRFLQVYDPTKRAVVPDPWESIAAGIPTRSFIIRVYTKDEAHIDKITEASVAVIERRQGRTAINTNI